MKSEDDLPKIVLPGVSVKENIAERKIEDILAPLDIGKTHTMIKKIEARIIIDKLVSEDVLKVVEKVASGLLGIVPERGDKLTIERIKFQENVFSAEVFLYPPNIFWLVLILIFLIAIIITLKDSTDVIVGNFARYVYGLEQKVDLPYENTVAISFVKNYEDTNSVKNNRGMVPVQNQVLALNLQSGILKYLTLKFDYAKSIDSTGTLKSSGTNDYEYFNKEDNAYRIGFESYLENITLTGGFQRIGPDFNSLGSPTIVKNRISKDFFSNVKVLKFLDIGFNYNDYEDNLNKSADIITTCQKIYTFSTGLNIYKLPMVNLGYTKNEIYGKEEIEKSLLNNYTNIIFGGISYSISFISLNIGFQDAKFRNEVSSVTNTDTLSGNIGLNFQFSEGISLNLGLNNTSIKDINDLSLNNLNTYNISSNCKIIPEKLVLYVWSSLSQRKDDDLIVPAETISQSFNSEISYYFNPKFILTLGGGVNNYKDNFDTTNNYTESQLLARVNISF